MRSVRDIERSLKIRDRTMYILLSDFDFLTKEAEE